MLIGLTGGVASGKSLVTEEFKNLGAHIIDADIIAREIVRPGTEAFGKIVSSFGSGVIRSDGTLDRARIAGIVFRNPEALKTLNKITHPPIRKKIEEEIKKLTELHPGELIVVDAALLIENRLHERMDRVVIVYATEKDQVERLKKRDGLTEEEAQLRLSSQMPLSEKIPYGDYIIDNTGTPEETISKARTVFEELGRENIEK